MPVHSTTFRVGDVSQRACLSDLFAHFSGLSLQRRCECAHESAAIDEHGEQHRREEDVRQIEGERVGLAEHSRQHRRQFAQIRSQQVADLVLSGLFGCCGGNELQDAAQLQQRHGAEQNQQRCLDQNGEHPLGESGCRGRETNQQETECQAQASMVEVSDACARGSHLTSLPEIRDVSVSARVAAVTAVVTHC